MLGWNLMDILFGNDGKYPALADPLKPEPEQIPIDINGDGIADGYVEVTAFDRDGDGIMDGSISTTYLDTDGNGTIDVITYDYDNGEQFFRFADKDGNGQFEYVPAEEETDIFAVPDSAFERALLPHSSPMDGLIAPPSIPSEYTGGDWPSLGENYDPNQASHAVLGNPGQAMRHWEYQGDSGPCAIFAQKFAIEELTGLEIDSSQMISVASQHGWYDGGTQIGNIGQMMAYYGLHTKPPCHGDIEVIERCLAQGGKVVAAVDGNEIWEGENDPFFFSPNDPNHAVEVIGIDYSDVNSPMVILNDSGTPDGRGLMIPQEQFIDAWEDSGCFMVEAYI